MDWKIRTVIEFSRLPWLAGYCLFSLRKADFFDRLKAEEARAKEGYISAYIVPCIRVQVRIVYEYFTLYGCLNVKTLNSSLYETCQLVLCYFILSIVLMQTILVHGRT